MDKIIKFLQKEAVLCVSGVLAVISCFFVRPSAEYIDYIDFRTLILLFCLMLSVAGIRKSGAFTALCGALARRFRSFRTAGLMLVLLSFFMSMLLTNDVTLITEVPFTLLLFERSQVSPKARIVLLVLETAAANLGSMLTPMGNPQNLYLYSKFGLTFGEFFRTVIPYSVMSLILVSVSALLFLPKTKVGDSGEKRSVDKKQLIVFLLLFAVCIMTVLRIFNERALLAAVIAVVFFADKKLFGSADYPLLLTFVFFFVFVGNIGKIPSVSEALKNILLGREVVISAALSQVMSNVPADILLSGLSGNATALIIGSNLGGLGTPIASMASLITYKFYAASEGSSGKKYMLIFTVFNVAFLAVLLGAAALLGDL